MKVILRNQLNHLTIPMGGWRGREETHTWPAKDFFTLDIELQRKVYWHDGRQLTRYAEPWQVIPSKQLARFFLSGLKNNNKSHVSLTATS